MQYIWILVIGLLAAAVAKLILPGQNGPRGVIWTAVIGVAGSFVGSFLGQFFGFYQPGELAGFVGSVAGAIIILLIWDYVARRRRS